MGSQGKERQGMRRKNLEGLIEAGCLEIQGR